MAELTSAPWDTPLRAPAALVDAFRRRATDAGLVDVAYGVIETPVARLTAAATDHGVVAVSYADPEELLPRLSRLVSPRVLEAPRRLDPLRRELDDYFAGRRRAFDVPLDWSLVASPFARRVLETTGSIGYGERSTYQRVASATGAPAASRAVGNALGANPLCIVVPCHRVLRTGGGLGGYAGGIERKEALLALEARVSGATAH